MPTRAILFDLDGTLVDSLQDIANSMNFVLENNGFPTHNLCSYRDFVGDGLVMLVRRALPAANRGDAVLGACVAQMRDAYRRQFLVRTRPYVGIPELLDALVARGVGLAVLSNKPHDLTVAMVAALFGRWPFGAVFGERVGIPRKPDPAAAFEAARLLDAEPGAVVYVGDTPIDIATAKAAGMTPVGVAWGFRSVTALEAAGAAAVVSNPMALLDHLVA